MTHISQENIVQAGMEDLIQLTALAYKVQQENGIDYIKTDVNRVSQYLFKVINNDCVLVYKDANENIKGFIVCEYGSPWWSLEPIFKESLYYVDKEYRKKGLAFVLKEAAENFNKERLNAPVVFELLTKTQLGLKEKFITQSGYETIGSLIISKK